MHELHAWKDTYQMWAVLRAQSRGSNQKPTKVDPLAYIESAKESESLCTEYLDRFCSIPSCLVWSIMRRWRRFQLVVNVKGSLISGTGGSSSYGNMPVAAYLSIFRYACGVFWQLRPYHQPSHDNVNNLMSLFAVHRQVEKSMLHRLFFNEIFATFVCLRGPRHPWLQLANSI